ncbi:hypothetical protein TNIN_95101 [Trichonephila inaurata madagascariensis]|uniref:Uncharacterized protein n=1 Tax=Trichonephila inaurata madagascariensis TaxID=2747483 RepID=A0A8X6YN72_9ARAC|nr:hypothetical protein TNIN_95101 [Trichonephila inaurata madagascariensis]
MSAFASRTDEDDSAMSDFLSDEDDSAMSDFSSDEDDSASQFLSLCRFSSEDDSAMSDFSSEEDDSAMSDFSTNEDDSAMSDFSSEEDDSAMSDFHRRMILLYFSSEEDDSAMSDFSSNEDDSAVSDSSSDEDVSAILSLLSQSPMVAISGYSKRGPTSTGAGPPFFIPDISCTHKGYHLSESEDASNTSWYVEKFCYNSGIAECNGACYDGSPANC